MKHKFTLLTLTFQAAIFSISSSKAAVMSVDIEEFNYTTPDLGSYYHYIAEDKLISNIQYTDSPNNTLVSTELNILDFEEKIGPTTPGVAGVNVDLLENTGNDNIFEIFLRPISTRTATHKLGITLDFEFDTNQTIESFQFNGGDLWFVTGQPGIIPTISISSNGKSAYIDYQFVVTANNPQGVNVYGNTAQFDKFTIMLGTTTVPEPTSVFLITIGTTALLSHRKRYLNKQK